VTAKPTVEELGIDAAAQHWHRSGDPTGRILVYDRHEWECFLDGVRNGEFDDGASLDALE
jgi:hypothetical protein